MFFCGGVKMFCKKCGCPLSETTYGRRFCKNCGILLENQDLNEESKLKKEEMEYAG